MSILVWLVVGAVVGSLAAAIMRERLGLLGNVALGIVGAAVGGLLFAHGDINNSPLTLGTFVVTLLGAVVLLGLVNLMRGGSLR